MTIVLLLLLVGLAAYACAHHRPPKAPAWPSGERAVSVHAVCPDGASSGSGVIVSRYRVLTAWHVVGCANAVLRVETITGHQQHVKLELADISLDVARLVTVGVGEFDLPSVALGPTPIPGDPVCTESGSPSRERRCGHVFSDSAHAGELQHNVMVVPGNSGSAIYDSKGRLVGLITNRYTERSGGYGTLLGSRPWLVR